MWRHRQIRQDLLRRGRVRIAILRTRIRRITGKRLVADGCRIQPPAADGQTGRLPVGLADQNHAHVPAIGGEFADLPIAELPDENMPCGSGMRHADRRAHARCERP